MEHVTAIKATIASLMGILTALWGWFGWLVLAWIACMAIDWITGTLCANMTGTWSSQAAREGAAHKGGSIITVITACVLDMVIGLIMGALPGIALPFDYTVVLSPLVIACYILTEMGSIVENVGKLGAPIPPWLEKAIEVLHDSVDATGNKATGSDGKE